MVVRAAAMRVLSRLLFTAAAGLTLVAGHVAGQERQPLVFVLAGQSNMVGQGLAAELTASQAVTPSDLILYLDGEQAGLLGRERFGPEVSLACQLTEALPNRELIFVKHARGGTSLLAWAPEWDAARAEITGNAQAGPLYAPLIQTLDRLGLGADAEIGAVFWMQGERDARFEGPAAEYFENLGTLIAAFRRDLNDPNLPFLLGLANPAPEQYSELETVQRAQRRAAAEIAGVYLIETDGLTKRDDGVHYDTHGALELGRRFAEAYLGVAEP